MGLQAVSSKASWQPLVTADTTTTSYWLNWRVPLCAVWVLISMIFASFLISKYEGFRNSGTNQSKAPGILYEDEVWKPCLKGIHPVWLLAFRVVAFSVLLILLILNAIVDGGSIFYFYTQWTFALVTIYFGLGSMLSMCGCYEYHDKVGSDRADNEAEDVEQGSSANGGGEGSNAAKDLSSYGQGKHGRQIASIWGYVFQIIFQMIAGAVILTDFIFWFIMVPFLATKDYELNFFMINMHTINAVFLLGETTLNCLRFPWFRIAYFFLWTSFYVIFQWILHACIALWWPYPFLDLSSSLAPLWYSIVAIMHALCFGMFLLIVKLKHSLLSRYFPQSCQCMVK
ncbi:hypothetical protein Nepgr_018631 [Nepenthes gracilis]|uniref:Uncharacterized protein n=1 Tax=Nepenthes gracilis TaxID=150966 RepID=A0AAD3SRU2_NEPGR|nr:hypothetical protein Nepgr_018631 [Nepenthes gracilis]